MCYIVVPPDVIGYGVFSKKHIAQTEAVLHYKGDLIEEEVAAERNIIYEKEHAGCFQFFFVHNGKTLWYV